MSTAGMATFAQTGDNTAQLSADDVYLPLITATSPPVINNPTLIYGINFIGSAEDPFDAQHYQNGLATGATWNRWPIYWFNVEQNPGVFNWSQQDAVVQADVTHGLHTNAILLGTPSFYTTYLLNEGDERPQSDDLSRTLKNHQSPLALRAPEAATPAGLYEPIFTDGTDVPGPGKVINDANVWARFVYTAVHRYKPGGILAQSQGWPAGKGVTHWEMWNEPDLDIFWDSSLPDYARLLKVGYLTAKQADPNAQILFGGLANNFQKLNYYNEVMAIYDGDALAGPYNYFHDILATHSYFYAWQSWYHVYRAANTLSARGLDKPIWLNESGVPAWNDYPGPVWDPQSGLRATMSEQADYLIQSAFFAAFAGADAIFHFQLYDGCGNQPRGTNFPPHQGELCDANGRLISDPNFPCAGDANGLFRNPTNASCFTQHSQPESPRPTFDAFKVLTTHFNGVEPLWRLRPGSADPANGPQEWIAFYRPETGERVLGLWTRFGNGETAVVPATHSSGLLILPDGTSQTIAAVNGSYILQLPAATNQNAFWDPTLYPIGGRPYILIEPDTIAPVVTASGQAMADGAIHLTWSGSDGLGSGMMNYDVYVASNGGAAALWLSATTATNAIYQGQPGGLYTFYINGRDRAGNMSDAAVVMAGAPNLTEKHYLPLIVR